jgi:hypothetical protein
MAKKKASTAKPKRAARKKQSRKKAGPPDTSVLTRYSPAGGAESHPHWVKTRFPEYIEPHAPHETTVVREFMHAGHTVKIITTYRVEVDGKPIQAHLSVDEDGRVFTHATPFVTYDSAVELMKAVVDTYPDAFSEVADGPVEPHPHGDNHGR